MINSQLKIITVEKVYKNFAEEHTAFEALKDISFQISKGDMLALSGSSGSGKTTLLNIIGGIDNASSGTVSIFGEKWEAKNENQKSLFRRQKFGFIFQSFNLFPVLTAVENIEIQLYKNETIIRSQIRDQAMSWLKKVGLSGFEHRKPSELSGGQRQRVAIARSMAHSPEIIFADEPTSSLDRTNSQNIMEILCKINHEEGVTIVFSSHDPTVLAKSSRCIQLLDGRIISDQRSS